MIVTQIGQFNIIENLPHSYTPHDKTERMKIVFDDILACEGIDFEPIQFMHLKTLEISSRNLRHVYFTTSNEFTIKYDAVNVNVIVHIPSTLKKLILTNIMANFDELPQALKTLHVNEITCHDIAKSKSLKHLTMHNYSGFALPDSLRSLTLKCKHEKELILPAKLKHLQLHNLPSNTKLPTFLRSLNVHICEHTLPSLPEYLRSLRIEIYMTGKMPLLPTGLKYLELHNYNGYDLFLPASLKTIILRQYQRSLSLGNIHNLRHLELQTWNGDKLFLGSSLKTLKLTFYTQRINQLPDTLRVLHLNAYQHALPNPLPERLKVMQLDKYNLHLAQLPDHLKTLIVPNVSAKLPTPLPPHLSYVVMKR